MTLLSVIVVCMKKLNSQILKAWGNNHIGFTQNNHRCGHIFVKDVDIMA